MSANHNAAEQTKSPLLKAIYCAKNLGGALGTSTFFRSKMSVNTSQDYYRHAGIIYKGLPLLDVNQTNLSKHFEEVIQFIDSALTRGGKVLVNCHLGVSRSPACVLAYLMIKHGMSVRQAEEQVRA